MVTLKRFNNEEFVVNADIIEIVEATPDTVVTLTTGKKLVVKNTIEEIVNMVIEYKRRCFAGIPNVKSAQQTPKE